MSHAAAPTAALGDRLVAFATDQIERLLDGPFRDWRLPRVWGGHPVDADVAADLAFTITHLRDAGVPEVGSAPIDGALQIVLRQVDGPNTHTFFSYRVAETLRRHGRFDDNHLLAGWTANERTNLREACDSTGWVDLLDDGLLPRNYHAVLARCELGRGQLGLVDDTALLDRLVEATRDMLAGNPRGFLDDSNSRFGRYDIYTADVHLFCEPLAERLGDVWDHGMATTLDLVRRVASPDGSAVGWGRSTGALAVCLTLELAALAIDRQLTDEPAAWLALAGAAADSLPGWFDPHGVITAHVHRSTYDYRGPQRRLQMSVDALGKIAEAGARLRRIGAAADAIAIAAAADLDDALVGRDEWVPFDDRNAGAWIVRTPRIAFTFPVTAPTVNDYLPAPHQPHRLEVPVQNPQPCGTPVAWVGHRQFVGGGLPSDLTHGPSTLHLRYNGFPRASHFDGEDKPPLPGSREVTWRVEGRSLVADEHWLFDDVPEVLVWQWAEVDGVPMSLQVETAAPHRVDTVDVQGLKDWRSFWNPLPRVHQVEFTPAAELRATIRLTTRMRVASTAFGHHYEREVYRCLGDEVDERQSPWHPLRADDAAEASGLDLFHMHWPEWVAFDDLKLHDEMIATLRREGVPIVWTQHNLTPHAKDPGRFDAVYQRWADAADAVIHHTGWGRAVVTDRYRFRADAEHRLIRHPHWGRAADRSRPVDRATAEEEFGLPPCELRLAIIGAPRHEKRTQAFMDGFARSTRDDVQLVVWALGPDDEVPDDPRIIAHRYEGTTRSVYDRRLRAVDVLVLPFADGMLATGTAFDAVSHGLAVMATDWGFLTETFAGAALACPLDPGEIADAVDALDATSVARSGAAVAALRVAHDPAPIAAELLDLFDALPRPARRF